MAKRSFQLLMLVGLVLLTFALAVQLQHLVWSTARIANQTSHQLNDVRIVVDDATVPIGNLAGGQSLFLRLPKRGEAIFSVEFSALGKRYRECREYVENDMYHVRVSVSGAFETACSVELGLGSRLMILELL